MNNLKNKIDDIVNNSGEKIAIIFSEINSDNCIYSINSDVQMVSASTIKVFIMLALFQEVLNNKLSLEDKILVSNQDILDDSQVFESGECYCTLLELVNWMIIISDNTATNIIINLLGMDVINKYISSLGLKSTKVERLMLDYDAIDNGLNNYVSQDDMFYVFKKLFNKEILNDDLCDKAIGILLNQRYKHYVTRYIYEPVVYAHKTGSLDYLNHDMGVMSINDKDYYIGISVYKSQYKQGNGKIIGQIGRVIYNYLLTTNSNSD